MQLTVASALVEHRAMPIRFMQIFLPAGVNSDLDELLEGGDVLGRWKDCEVEGRDVLHLLAPAEETEAIMDRLESRFAGVENFKVVLFPVEAVLPRPEPEQNDASRTDSAVANESEKSAKNAARISREELYQDITESIGLNRVYLAMTVLSSIVAAVGLMRDDVAVVIGAMVIAPLLGPNVAMSFATTLGDIELLRRALLTNVVGVGIALALAILIGLLLSVDPAVPAIAARTQVNLTDIVLALAAGSAGTYAFTRGMSGAVIGVMVAVALLPPLVAFGMLLGAGQFAAAFGAMVLTATNVICINLAGVGTFLLQGVRPRTWWEEERARKATRIAMLIWVLLLVLLTVILAVTQTDRA